MTLLAQIDVNDPMVLLNLVTGLWTPGGNKLLAAMAGTLLLTQAFKAIQPWLSSKLPFLGSKAATVVVAVISGVASAIALELGFGGTVTLALVLEAFLGALGSMGGFSGVKNAFEKKADAASLQEQAAALGAAAGAKIQPLNSKDLVNK